MFYIKQHAYTIINTYDGGLPLTHFLKNYFRKNPKLGSRDRKILSTITYSWFRCAPCFKPDWSIDEKIHGAIFLSENISEHLLKFLPEDWQKNVSLSLQEKIEFINKEEQCFDIEKMMPFDATLSKEVSRTDFYWSMLRQPALFIRLRNNRNKAIEQTLSKNDIPFQQISTTSYALLNGVPIDKILPQEDYVVQDLSSQQTGDFFHPQQNETWWDCCAGAGGKSLLLKDLEPSVLLTVSDARASILSNLQARFQLYRHPAPNQCVVDVSNANELQQKLARKKFQHIICDAPCTGSGTWARTPEQLYFFREELIVEYANRQKKIATNALQFLESGGRFFYITCSVFQAENEEVVLWLKENNHDVELISMKLINGINQKADSMFIAVFQKL